MKTLPNGSLVPETEQITGAIDAHQEGQYMAIPSVHLPFDFSNKESGRNLYQAAGLELNGTVNLSNTYRRPFLWAAMIFTRAAKITKTGLVSTDSRQWLDRVFFELVGSTTWNYHTKPTKTRPYPTISLDADGVTDRGIDFFKVSSGKLTDSDIRTVRADANAAQMILNGLRKGGAHEIVMLDCDEDKSELVRFTLNFAHPLNPKVKQPAR